MTDLLNRIITLTSQVTSLMKCINVQNSRIQKLEGNSDVGSESGEESAVQPREAKIGNRERKKVKVKSKVKKQKLRGRGNAEMSSQLEEEAVSDERLNLSALSERTKCKKKHRDVSRVDCFSSDESGTGDRSSSALSSDSEVGRRRKRRRRVKSGAEVKQRPVVKTELWPHTIANEEDGEDVTSEDISLAKFLSCFTHIVTTSCEAVAAGRSLLLHAVSTVLEFLPWAEARTFHNLMMVKVEQRRIDWSSDFSALADKFLVNKVRKNLRSKTSQAGYSYYDSFNNNSFSKGHGSFGSKNNVNSPRNSCNSNNNLPLYSFVCKQWNTGACSYGTNCRRWHTCWSCAEAGKLGEPHKASIHYGSTARSSQENQYI